MAKLPSRTAISRHNSLEEAFFLGLRLNRGVNLLEVAATFGVRSVTGFSQSISEFANAGLLEVEGDVVRLTSRGRLLSNEVFERFIAVPS